MNEKCAKCGHGAESHVREYVNGIFVGRKECVAPLKNGMQCYCKKFTPQNHSPQGRAGSPVVRPSTNPEDKEPEADSNCFKSRLDCKTSGSDDETLSDKEQEFICIDEFFWKKDVREFIKKLKEGCGKKIGLVSFCGVIGDTRTKKYSRKYIVRYCEDCKKWIEKIDKRAGENLI